MGDVAERETELVAHTRIRVIQAPLQPLPERIGDSPRTTHSLGQSHSVLAYAGVAIVERTEHIRLGEPIQARQRIQRVQPSQ